MKYASRLLIAATILLLAFGASSQPSSRSVKSELYAVVLGVTRDSRGAVDRIRVARVINVDTEETSNLEVPPEYLRIAKARLVAAWAPDPNETSEKYTYYYFDPSEPSNVIADANGLADWRSRHPKQP